MESGTLRGTPSRPKWLILGGLVLSLISGTNKAFGWIQGIDWLHTNAPSVYGALMSPMTEWIMIVAGLAMAFLGLYELYQFKHKAGEVQEENAGQSVSTETHGHTSHAASVSGDVKDSSFHVGDIHYHYSQESRGAEQAKTPPQVIESQIREIARIENFVTRKDEWSLRSMFDFPDILRYNMLQIKHSLDKQTATPESAEEARSFFANGQGRMDLRFMVSLGQGHGGTMMTGKPGCFYYMNVSKTYVDARMTLSGFCASSQLPSSIIEALKEFELAIEANTSLILATINESLAVDKRYILEADLTSSPYLGKTNALYVSRFIKLRPKADDISAKIRTYLGVS